MKKQEKMQENWLQKKHLSIKNTGFLILAILIGMTISQGCSTTSQGQAKTPSVDVHKLDVHFSVGRAIENEETRKALEMVSEIKEIGRASCRERV